MKDNFKIVFMGSPEFAVDTLDILVKGGYNIAGVVTVPDKPSGRGQLIKRSPVKEYAVQHGFKVLQPFDLSDVGFINELSSLNADLQVVVAFRILPKIIWDMPVNGTINLHASLLPQYRGAAPINWTIINGEKQTGVTTFLLEQKVDTGNILFQESVDIFENETAGELHDRLKVIGARLVLKTVNAIKDGKFDIHQQDKLIDKNVILKPAPKIFREDCRINWNRKAVDIHNKIRGLSPNPTAFTELISPDGELIYIKIFRSSYEIYEHKFSAGKIIVQDNNAFRIAVKDGFINLEEVQLSGKNRMNIKEFLMGFNIDENWTV